MDAHSSNVVAHSSRVDCTPRKSYEGDGFALPSTVYESAPFPTFCPILTVVNLDKMFASVTGISELLFYFPGKHWVWTMVE